MRFPLVWRSWSSRFCLLLLFGLCGCMASESQQGDSFIYKKTILYTLLLLGISITMSVFGGGILNESLKKPKSRKRKRANAKRSRERREQESAPSSKKKTGGILLGGVLLFGGILILLLGVPASLMQHITVYPDKLEMRISPLWFAKGTREISFAQIGGIEKIEKDVVARRGKRIEETMILHLDSGTERIEMGPLEKAAFPKLVEMYEAYKNEQKAAPANPNIAQNQPADPLVPPNNPSALPPQVLAKEQHPPAPPFAKPPFGAKPIDSPAKRPSHGSLTPVDRIGRLFPGSSASVRGLNARGYTRATILETYSEGKLKVIPYGKSPAEAVIVDVSQARPGSSLYVSGEFGPGTPIDNANPPAPGTRLLAPYAGRWFEAELLQWNGSSARVRWKGERSPANMPSKFLRIVPPGEIENFAGKRYNPQQAPSELKPVDRIGTLAKGKEVYFKEAGSGPPRKVRILQPYLQQVHRVQDLESAEIFYAFRQELSSRP